MELKQQIEKVLICGLLVLIGFSSLGQDKRGIAYGYHSPEDMEVLSPSVSWWYNWSEIPENSVANVYEDYGFEFVPMTWNGNFDSVKLVTFLSDHPDTKYLLAFNEPNFIEQANMTPTEAAAVWPVLESIADAYDLEIVGPAVNFCGNCVEENGIVYNSPFDYLDDFFEACQGCRVDYIAIHSYMNTVSALDWYINEFKAYGKPIWLTEFAGWEPNGIINDLDDQINFMIGAVDLLEYDTAVYKYSWFIGRGPGIQNYPYIDLLGANGELTTLGEIYCQMPVHDENHVVPVPARLEAENYNSMHGILLERTLDQTGFANVGYIDAGDWLEYRIHVQADTVFPVYFRIASTSSGSFHLMIDGVNTITQNFTNTGGWQNWTTLENSFPITAGEHQFRIVASTPGFNINWFQVGDVVSSDGNLPHNNGELIVYPNPASHTVRVVTNDPGECIVQLMDITGRLVLRKPLPVSGEINVSGLAPGVYLLHLETEKYQNVTRIIKE